MELLEVIPEPKPQRELRIKNYLNRDTFPKNYKHFTMPSETIPDQSLTIRQILDRYARGLPLDAKQPLWDHNADIDDVLPDPRTLDLAERQDFVIQAKAELDEVKAKIAEKRKKKPIIEPEITDPPAQLEN